MTSFAILKKNLSQNWKSGLTVALVSIPLSISLAIASGATPVQGLITAVWAGAIGGFLGSSNYNVIGPAGALSGVLATYAAIHGSTALPLVALGAAICIFAIYLFRGERFLRYIPESVMHGFSLAVALIIAINQLAFAFGLYRLEKSASVVATLVRISGTLSETHFPTLVLTLLGICFLFVVTRLLPKIPGPVLLAPVGILIGYASKQGSIPFETKLLTDLYHSISFTLFEMPSFALSLDLVKTAVVVAIVAIIETIISANIADIATKTKHNEHREVFGLGFANALSGLFGGLPATGVFARTSINLKNGATHKTSTVIHAICIAVVSLFLFKYFMLLPLAIVAAILLFAAMRMVEFEVIVALYKKSKADVIAFTVAALVAVLEDPLYGICAGTVCYYLLIVVSQRQFLRRTSQKDWTDI